MSKSPNACFLNPGAVHPLVEEAFQTAQYSLNDSVGLLHVRSFLERKDNLPGPRYRFAPVSVQRHVGPLFLVGWF